MFDLIEVSNDTSFEDRVYILGKKGYQREPKTIVGLRRWAKRQRRSMGVVVHIFADYKRIVRYAHFYSPGVICEYLEYRKNGDEK